MRSLSHEHENDRIMNKFKKMREPRELWLALLMTGGMKYSYTTHNDYTQPTFL
jgi:hypothetical protein